MNIEQTLRRAVLKNGTLKRKELVTELKGQFSESQIDKGIKKLVDEGILGRVAPGEYKAKEDSELDENRKLVEETRKRVEVRKRQMMLKKTMKSIKKLKKKNVQYIRDKTGALRKLETISNNLAELVLLDFVQGTANQRYQALNAKARSWRTITPVTIGIEEEYKSDFEGVLNLIQNNSREIVTTINGSYIPFARIVLKSEQN